MKDPDRCKCGKKWTEHELIKICDWSWSGQGKDHQIWGYLPKSAPKK